MCDEACAQRMSRHSSKTVQFWVNYCKLNNKLLPISKQRFYSVAKYFNIFVEHADEKKGIKLRDDEDLYKSLRK